MEPGTHPRASPKNKRRRLLVLAVAVIVVASGIVAWEVFRPRSIAEFFAMDHLEAGSQLGIGGVITGIFRTNTTYGPQVSLELDHDQHCPNDGNVFGNPNATYSIGATFQTTLHFQSYTVNGDPAVWAPELACPFPGKFQSIQSVSDATGLLRGILLTYIGTDSTGWSQYRLVTQNGHAYRPDILPATLRKSLRIQGSNPQLPAGGPIDSAARWSTLADLQYLGVSGAYAELPIVDRMASLSVGTSTNGSLRFVDVNGNGRVDTGDRLDVRLPRTALSTSWDTYELIIGGLDPPDTQYANTFHFTLNGPTGPLEVPLRQRSTPVVDLRYVGDRYGTELTTELEVTGVPVGTAPPFGNVRFFLEGTSLAGNLSDLPATTNNGSTLRLVDANGDGRLDTGDLFTLDRVANGTHVDLDLMEGNTDVGKASWTVGYGQPVGLMPSPYLLGQGTDPWRLIVSRSFWTPDLALNGTLRFSFLENHTFVFTNQPVRDGSVATFANGSVGFTDADHDATLSNGDFFTIQGNPNNTYDVQLFIFQYILAVGSVPP